MCGIWALFGLDAQPLACICENFEKIKHRGPEAFKFESDTTVKVRFLQKIQNILTYAYLYF